MNREKRLIVLFLVLWLAAGLIAAGIFYFNAHGKTNDLLSENTAATAQLQGSQGDLSTVETIPNSTVSPSAATTTATTPPANLSLPYSLNARTATSTYWPKGWGGLSFKDNDDLVLVPDPTSHGANTFLTGASPWTNYSVNANASWLMGGWFDIVARVSNNTQNFVYCEFGSNGTEIIERVNGNDTQIAAGTASTTAIQGATENFGMKVYGNEIACMMANQEVVGAEDPNKEESAAGGIGFVIFGQPQQQQGVTLSNVSVSALTENSIIVPFPAAPVVSAASSSAAAPAVSTTTAPVPAPAATTTPVLSLPYSTSVFDPSDWDQGWGYFSTASGTLDVGSNGSITSGGIFLAGSNTWTDYKFTAYVEWISGQVFELVARRTDSSDLIECVYDEADAADTTVSINMLSNGQTTALTQGQTFLDNSAHMTAVGFEVSMSVQGSNVQCEMDNQTVAAGIPNGLLTQGGIGFITWDPQPDNSQINVTKVSVTPL